MNSSSIIVASSVARRLRRPSSLSSSASHYLATRAASTILSSSSTAAGIDAISNNNSITTTQSRSFGSGGGTRGARGHGWWINYRAGKGGRHLQGTYAHLDDIEIMAEWNDAVFSLGSQMAYVDIQVESLSGAADAEENNNNENSSKTSEVHRLKLELATAAMPLATDNVLKLLQAHVVENTNNNKVVDGYLSSTLHRIEKGVGILGGLVSKNPNAHPNASKNSSTKTRIGRCHPDYSMATKGSPTAMDISQERLVLQHVPGVITMLQPRIGEIDSRFMMLSHHAPHMDGVSVAVGRLAPGCESSLEAIQKWESSLITSYGIPTNVILRVVGCGLLDMEEEGGEQPQGATTTTANTTATETKQMSSSE